MPLQLHHKVCIFIKHVVNICYSLPYDAVDFSSLPAFKRTIEMTLFFPSSRVFWSLLDYT